MGIFLLLIPGLAIWIYSMYEAYITAGKMNARTLEFRPMRPVHMVLFIATAVLIVITVVVAVILIVISTMLSHLVPAGNADLFQMFRSNGRLP